jgi:hypothetical protein
MAVSRIEQNINQFISVFKQGARPNRYRVDVVKMPGILEPYLAKAYGGKVDNFYFFCKAASLPEDSIGVVEVPFMGRKFKVHGDRTFNEWSITILNEEGNMTRRFFEYWMHHINTHVSNIRILPQDPASYTNADSYYATFRVTQLRVDGDTELAKETGQYYFNYTFPSNVAAVDLAFDNNDTVEEFAVTLQYTWWGVKDSSDSSESSEDSFFNS